LSSAAVFTKAQAHPRLTCSRAASSLAPKGLGLLEELCLLLGVQTRLDPLHHGLLLMGDQAGDIDTPKTGNLRRMAVHPDDQKDGPRQQGGDTGQDVGLDR
jgi:hypothetical protein